MLLYTVGGPEKEQGRGGEPEKKSSYAKSYSWGKLLSILVWILLSFFSFPFFFFFLAVFLNTYVSLSDRNLQGVVLFGKEVSLLDGLTLFWID